MLTPGPLTVAAGANRLAVTPGFNIYLQGNSPLLRYKSHFAINEGLLRSNAIEDSLEEHRVGPLDRDGLVTRH